MYRYIDTLLNDIGTDTATLNVKVDENGKYSGQVRWGKDVVVSASGGTNLSDVLSALDDKARVLIEQ